MVRVRLESIAPRGDIKSDNIYTYYYCPDETKRIFVNVNHEVVETHEIEKPKIYDGVYAGIVSIKSRSATIEKMNVGEILPLISLYGKDDTVKEYPVPLNPDSIVEEEILSTEADVDLGEKAWICLRDPSTGKSHGLILDSIEGLAEGEEDGIQVKAFVKQNVKLPGLEADSSNLFLMKNAYDKGREQVTVLNQGFKVSFNAELITVENDGYEKIDAESEIFQSLIKEVPIYREGISEVEEEEVERYSLTSYVHFAPSVPLGSLLCAALGKNIPYIYAELYEDNGFMSSGSAGRISLASIDLDFEGKNIFQKLKTVIGMFDWRNVSFFKKIVFPDLETGEYVVKIYRQNRFFGRERQYIGYAIVDLAGDSSVHINCRSERTIESSVLDQNNEGVENVRFLLERDGAIIADTVSDNNGSAILKAPNYPTKPYTLKVFYQGFLIEEKNVKLGTLNNIFPIRESFSIDQHGLSLNIKDTWGFSPFVDVNPMLTSNEMAEPIVIYAEKTGDGEYLFTNLYPAEYTLSMSYKSFDLAEIVKVENDKSLDLVFPAEFELNLNNMDSYGNPLDRGEVEITRISKNEKVKINKDGDAVFSVPPGKYEISVYVDDEEIAKQKVDIYGDKTIDMLSKKGSFLNNVVFYLGLLLLIVSIFLMLWKKKIYTGLKLLTIALLVIALVSPWWSLTGDSGTVETNTDTLLVPSRLVSLTTSDEIIGGDINQVPEEVPMVLGLLSMLVPVVCLLIFLGIFSDKKLRKTSILLSILSFILLLVIIGVFYYAMSQITEVGVGVFMGSGDLEITLPGTADIETINCSLGPGLGFILTTAALILMIAIAVIKNIKPNLFSQ